MDRYLEAGEYDWRGISEYNSLGEKIRRGIRQFTPYTWTVYNWHMLQSFRRFLYVLALIFVVLVRRRRCARRAVKPWLDGDGFSRLLWWLWRRCRWWS